MKPTLFLISLFLFCFYSTKAQTIIYVDSAATGIKNGVSWDSAFSSLQDALELAQDGDQIWVAKGTYLPTKDENDLVPTHLSLTTFSMRFGVEVYGGFAKGDSSLGQRDWKTNKSILSGKRSNSILSSDRVVNIVSLDQTAVLDGFMITGGNRTLGSGGITRMHGSGLDIAYSSPVLRNLRLSGNFSYSGIGAGIYCTASSPLVVNSVIESNGAARGAGISMEGLSNPIFVNCIIRNNNCRVYGGGVYSYQSNATFINCQISDNTAMSFFGANELGGGFYNYQSVLTLINVTLADNTVDTSNIFTFTGTAMRNFENTTVNVYNSVIEGEIANHSTSTITFYNSIVDSTGGSANWNSTFGIDSGGNPPPPAYFVSGENDYRLDHCSPGFDAGSNIYLPSDTYDLDKDGNTTEPIPVDLLGNPRVLNGTVDIGAIETQPVAADSAYFQICAGDSLLIGDSVITAIGTYTVTYPRTNQCDSLVTNVVQNTVPVDIVKDVNGHGLYVIDSNASYQWYDCIGDSILSGDTNQRFNPVVMGTYAAIISKSGCTDTSACLTINQINLPESDFSPEIHIYPNPGLGQFLLNVAADKVEHVKLSVSDINGRFVLRDMIPTGSDYLLDLTANPAGIYLVHILTSNGKTTARLVKH